jgi:hypothetical protein
MYRYTIEFPITCNSYGEIEKALNIDFAYNRNSESYNYFGDSYCIEVFDLFWYNECDPNHEPDSEAIIKFDELNITLITDIMTKICDVLKNTKKFNDFTINRCVICDNITKQTKSLVSYIE